MCCQSAISHYPASASAGNSWQITYFEASKASVAAAGTIKGKRFDLISGRVHRNRIDAQHTKGKTVKTGMQHAGRQVRLLWHYRHYTVNWLTVRNRLTYLAFISWYSLLNK